MFRNDPQLAVLNYHLGGGTITDAGIGHDRLQHKSGAVPQLERYIIDSDRPQAEIRT